MGQVALTMSRSSDSSPAQPLSAVGREVVEPVWLTLLAAPVVAVGEAASAAAGAPGPALRGN